ncbi:MAG: cysteine peptidase family C39 domain-containing protein [Pirellulales bacterium]
MLILLSLVPPYGALCSDHGAAERYDVSANRCGPLALRLCARFIEADVSGDEIDRAVTCGNDGCSMLALAEAAESVGLRTLPVRWDGAIPAANVSPAVIRVRLDDDRPHFVAMLAVRKERVLICDVGNIFGWVRIERLKSEMGWDGHALHIAARAADLENLRSHLRAGAPATVYVPCAAATLFTFMLAGCIAARRLFGRHAAEDLSNSIP